MKPTILTTFNTMTQNLRGNSGWGMLRNGIKQAYKYRSRIGMKDASIANTDISQFVAVDWQGTKTIFGLSDDSAGAGIQLIMWDAALETWSTPANSQIVGGSRDENLLFYFEGYVYGYKGNAVIWRYGDTRTITTNAITSAWHTGSWTTKTLPIKIGANAYFAMDNIVYELASGGSSLSTRFTLSPDRIITSLASRGQSLSVMTYDERKDESREFLFSLGDSEITNAYDDVDWGTGKVVHHAEVNNVVVAVQDEHINNTGDRDEGTIKLKVNTKTVHEIRSDGTATLKGSGIPYIGLTKQVQSDALMFYITYAQENVAYEGICKFSSNWDMEIILGDDYATGITKGFILNGNQWLVSHSDGSVAYTKGTTEYPTTVITRKIDNGDPMQEKQVKGVSVSFTPMTSTATDYVKVYYKDQDQTTWTQIAEMLGSAENSGKTRLGTIKEVSSADNLRIYQERQYEVEFVGVDFLGLRTAKPAPINSEQYTV